MIPGDNTTALERLARHQPKPGRIWPWFVALLMYLLWDSITGLGARIELLF
jgi:hypothetical protein